MIRRWASNFLWAILGLSLYLYDSWAGQSDSGVPRCTPPTVMTCDSRLTLTTLPFEMIVEVMKYLDWRSLLRIRQVRRCYPTYQVRFLSYSSDVQTSRCCFKGPHSLGNPIPSIYAAITAFRTATGIVLGT